jgi:GNAT superfamily N-acetyltransferase
VDTGFTVRRATAADAAIIARHRAEMFSDMGLLPQSLYDRLMAETARYLEAALGTEEYVAWLASPLDLPQQVVAGAGILNRRVLPHPLDVDGSTTLASGRQGIVLNVFTERPWRRRGLASLLMREVMAWAANNRLETLVLHASDEGRPVYEKIGFVATNEMRYRGRLLRG